MCTSGFMKEFLKYTLQRQRGQEQRGAYYVISYNLLIVSVRRQVGGVQSLVEDQLEGTGSSSHFCN